MNKNIINISEDEKILNKVKKFDIKKNIHLIALLLAGLIILLFTGNDFTFDNDEITDTEINSNAQVILEYENRLTDLISQIEGAGKVEVMITLESSGETVYAKTQTGDEQINNESGDTSIKTGYSTEYIIVEDNNGNKTALVENEYEPNVLGVAVLCEGGNNTTIISDITELVKVVMGVPSNRIFVGKINNYS